LNAVEIEEAISLLADQPFDPGSFPYAFLEAFGNKETTIKRLKSGSTTPPTSKAAFFSAITFTLSFALTVTSLRR
jgi:hypothetical protein